MNRWWRNERGLTLAELLGALAIMTFLVGTITYVTMYASKGVQNATTKEDVIMESRTILNHIVQAVRSETATASQDTANILKLDYKTRDDVTGALVSNGNRTYYTFTSGADGNGSFSFNSQKGTNALSAVLSKHVKSATITVDNRKIDIKLVMQLPNDQDYEASTVVYFPKLIIS
ncbi:prepilin-type N-terminal cleavage/methylation domain-containing protein [Cohnella sp. GCM10027633]|uniref:prepilin-type N-terminal cleavage/methylation domain-containing protein n=1 Tax=unclassified Cohnella TaxID=2636738 RepID=UPI0036339616